MLPISALKPYDKNPRHNKEAVDKVAASLREFGFRQPIVVDKDYVIIVGHTRLLAAKKLKLKEVPVLVADDLTDEQAKAYRLADNKTAEFSKWDEDLLNLKLSDLLDLDFDMEQFGFELNLDEDDDQDGGEIEEDEVPEEAESRVHIGDVWQLGTHRLICGDSTDVNVIDKLLDGNEPDLVLTDPPYGINVVGNNGEVGANFGIAKKGKYEQIIADDTTETAQAAYNLLQTLCDKLILWGGNYFLDFLPPSDGWLIWDKRGESGIRNTFADGEMAWCSFHTPVRIYHQLWNGMIREGEHEKRVHPTQKPVRMLSEVITDFSSEGAAILDVFGGSGSTMMACEQTGRRCFMCELSEHYCDVILQRYINFKGSDADVFLLKDGKKIPYSEVYS